jgi:hypothetical protein
MGDRAAPIAKINPAQPRRSAVEREILRCAVAGVAADFTGERWKRIKRIDGRPVVQGTFLAELWQGLAGANVHPGGLKLSDLHIAGTFMLDGIRIDARLRSPLAGLFAERCRFEKGIALAYSRCEAVLLRDCSLGLHTENVEGSGQGPSLYAPSIDLVGRLDLADCRIEGDVNLANAVVDDDVKLERCEVAGTINGSGAEIRGGLSLMHSSVRGTSPAGSAWFAAAEISGGVVAFGCRFAHGLSLSQAEAQLVAIHRSVMGGIGVNVEAMTVRTILVLRGLRIRGAVTLEATQVGGRVHLVELCIVGPPAALNMSAANVAGNLSITRIRLRGTIGAEAMVVGGSLDFRQLRLLPGKEGLYGLRGERIAAASLTIEAAIIAGVVDLGDAELGQLHIARSLLTTGGSMGACCGDAPVAGMESLAALWASRMRIRGAATLDVVGISGGATFESSRIGTNLLVDNCWVGNDRPSASVNASTVQVGNIIALRGSVLPAGIDFHATETVELQIAGCMVGRGTIDSRRSGTAIHAIGLAVRQDVALWSWDGPDGAVANAIDGAIAIRESRIGSSFLLTGTTIRDGQDRGGTGIALNLTGLKVGAWLRLDGAGEQENAPGLRIEGSICLHGVTADRVSLDDGVAIIADDTASAGERSASSYSSFALSLRQTRVERRMTVARCSLSGRVELADTFVGTLADSGGTAWTNAGVGPGALLLEGFTYGGLDDDRAAAADAGQGTTVRPEGTVARRLDWLAMQYPGGTADAASFTPQPYEQLAHHYGALGDERARRQVLVRKRQLQRNNSGLGWVERSVSGLLGLTSNYGYSPGRATVASAVLVAIGALAAWGLYAAGAIVPSEAEDSAGSFSPLLFAIDVAVPFLDLGHDGDWRIDPTRLRDWPGRTLVLGMAEAIYRLAGLAMLSITVLTFSGILHEKD